jgi:hypothetical protein
MIRVERRSRGNRRKENIVKFLMSMFVLMGLVAVVSGSKAHVGDHAKAKAAVAAPARPPRAEVKKVDLTGEIVDPQCWFTHNGEGKDHAGCAVRCARGGQDLAFLDARSGELHTLIATGHGKNPNDGLYEKVGVPVRVRGTLYQRGTNSGLLLEGVQKIR